MTRSAPNSPELGPAICEVHLARLAELRVEHEGLLSRTELARRAEFRQTADRARYTLATALLRTVVGRWRNVAPGDVQLDRTCHECGRAHGRPRLSGTGLHASISHAAELVAVAVTPAGPVGVDVERIRAGVEAVLARTVCAVEERDHVRSDEDFFVCWTRKEAVLKATGEGLRRALAEVVLSAPDEPPELRSLSGDTSTPCRLADLDAGDGYKGAVALLTDKPVEIIVHRDALRTADVTTARPPRR